MKREKSMIRFIRFLKENKVYTNFMWEYQKGWNQTRSIKTYFANTLITEYIIEAFNWEDTKNGETFWVRLSRQWQDVSFKYNIQKWMQQNNS